ncbi:hypothetical protein [Streptomyces sp. NPDC020597]|uniref:hypothetical protein n=1 Tax=unclassified Streptomyces TaxID=2593676 RepID=UPI00378C0721
MPRATSPGGLVHRDAAGASSAALRTAGLRSSPLGVHVHDRAQLMVIADRDGRAHPGA